MLFLFYGKEKPNKKPPKLPGEEAGGDSFIPAIGYLFLLGVGTAHMVSCPFLRFSLLFPSSSNTAYASDNSTGHYCQEYMDARKALGDTIQSLLRSYRSRGSVNYVMKG